MAIITPLKTAPHTRIEKSFGITILAYLLLIRVCHQEILPGKAWSVSQLQYVFRLRVITNQVEHNVKTRPSLALQPPCS